MTDFEYCKNTEYIQDISWHKQKKLHGYPVTYTPDSPPRVFSTFCASGIIKIRAYIGYAYLGIVGTGGTGGPVKFFLTV